MQTEQPQDQTYAQEEQDHEEGDENEVSIDIVGNNML